MYVEWSLCFYSFVIGTLMILGSKVCDCYVNGYCVCVCVCVCVWVVCPESIQPYSMKNRDIYWRTYKIKQTLYIGVLPASFPLFKVESSSSAQYYGLKSLPFQRCFSFWAKPEVEECQILAVRGLSHLGGLMFCQKTLYETWCMSGCVVMKLPVSSFP